MHYATILSILALATSPFVIAEGESCKYGFCTTSSNCLNNIKGSVSTGLCPGPDSNRCCDTSGVYSCGTRGTGMLAFFLCYNSNARKLTKFLGTCKTYPGSCSGAWQTGFCPFGNDFRCCN